MKSQTIIVKIFAVTMALMFSLAGVVMAKTACLDLCGCHSKPVARPRVHQAFPKKQHRTGFHFINASHGLRPMATAHSDSCHTKQADTCRMELAQTMVVLKRAATAPVHPAAPLPVAGDLSPLPLKIGDTAFAGSPRSEPPILDLDQTPLYLENSSLII